MLGVDGHALANMMLRRILAFLHVSSFFTLNICSLGVLAFF